MLLLQMQLDEELNKGPGPLRSPYVRHSTVIPSLTVSQQALLSSWVELYSLAA